MIERSRIDRKPTSAIFVGEQDGGRMYVLPIGQALTDDEAQLVADTIERIEARGRDIDAKYYNALGHSASHPVIEQPVHRRTA
jgi:hypothetical protein